MKKIIIALIMSLFMFSFKYNEDIFIGSWKIIGLKHSSIIWNSNKLQKKYIGKIIVIQKDKFTAPFFQDKCETYSREVKKYTYDDFEVYMKVKPNKDLKISESSIIYIVDFNCITSDGFIFVYDSTKSQYYIFYDGAYYKVVKDR